MAKVSQIIYNNQSDHLLSQLTKLYKQQIEEVFTGERTTY